MLMHTFSVYSRDGVDSCLYGRLVPMLALSSGTLADIPQMTMSIALTAIVTHNTV